MSDWQLLYLALLIGATAGGWRDARLCAVMWGNFAVTLTSNADPWAVATADILCAVILIGHGWRANLVAGLFVAMVPVYLIGAAFQWPSHATYAIIDVLAYLQCGVVGRVDRGGARLVGLGRRAAGALRRRAGRAFSGGAVVALRRDTQKDS